MSLKKLPAQLSAFDKVLLKKFKQYLNTGYFRATPAAIALFTYFEKLHPAFDKKKLMEKAIAAKEPRLPNLNSQAKAGGELQKALDHFLALEQWEKKEKLHPLYLLQAQKQLGLHEAFEATARKFEKKLETCTERDFDYFENKHLLTEIEFNGFKARLQRNYRNDLQPVTQTLDEFYALKKLRYHCELLSRNQILGTPYSEENTEELLRWLQPFTNSGYPYVYLFVNVYQMMKASTFEAGESYYQLILAFITNGNYQILPQGIIETISYLINYCLMWNNKGVERAGANALWWYEMAMKHGLLVHNSLMQPAEFRNIVSLAISNQKADRWLKLFIDQYAPCLPAEHAAVNHDFALAQFYYYKKDYTKAMPLFQRAQAKDEPVFNMIVRRWQFACMYEQDPDNKDLLYDFLVTWERQLHRQAEGLHQLKQIFARVINYSKKLLAAGDPALKVQLMGVLEKEPYFAGKAWLMVQLKDNRQRGMEASASSSA